MLQSDEDPGQVIADALMAVADFHGQNPGAKVDRRAWDHAMVYAPKDMKGDEAERLRCRRLMDRCLNEAWDKFASEINPK